MYRSLRTVSKDGRKLATKQLPRWQKSCTAFSPTPRLYHSGVGVYGHREKSQRLFKVPTETVDARSTQANLYRLISAYRELGHKQANINPIALASPELLSELNIDRFGFVAADQIDPRRLIHVPEADRCTVAELVEQLRAIYCNTLSAEFSYLESEEEREWFARNFEECHYEAVTDDTRRAIALKMLESQAFDRFLAIKFVSFKRYGAEGAESMMAFYHELFNLAAEDTLLKEVVIGMAHRGRLNFLTGMLGLPAEKLFRKIRGGSEFPNGTRASGDVVSHLVSSIDLVRGDGIVRVGVVYNPSHLEAVNPVSMGKTRGLMQLLTDGAYSQEAAARFSDKVLNLQVHGDGAYVGQGVNQESLSLSGAPHFEVGGTIHLVINNQIGFTCPATRGRSSRYCTDLAKFIAAPVLHVNGDDPEMVVRAARLAFRYQREFRKDVFVDLNCFRRWGHNELDDPTFTNPHTYNIIQNRPSTPDRYLTKLTQTQVLTEVKAVTVIDQYTRRLSQALQNADSYMPKPSFYMERWSCLQQAESAITTWDTGVDGDLLRFIGARSVHYPDCMSVHPLLLKGHVNARLKRLEAEGRIDWSTAEALAFGSLLYEGYHIRISGQDVGRGTFSHRHAMLVDQSTGAIHVPLNSMVDGQTGKLEIANSILSEEAVLGYEYGMSITLPNTLVLWEAQFGDFFNGAQIMIDTFVSSGEAKWMTASGLTILLPHGYDGAGPEHSSSKFERFLQLTNSKETSPDGDDVNMHVTNPTTPAQYFHLLRRQMVRNFRKPLIIVAPKILLRHVSATSTLNEMEIGTSFKPIIGDDNVDERAVSKIILVSGKHFYAIDQYRKTKRIQDVAIIRVESLCPFPVAELNDEIEKYKYAKTFIWSQEEPQNMGAWMYIKPRFENLCRHLLRYSGLEPLATSASGIGQLHQRESEEVVNRPFEMK